MVHEYCYRGSAIAIGCYQLVKHFQFRYPAGQFKIDLIAGQVDVGVYLKLQ